MRQHVQLVETGNKVLVFTGMSGEALHCPFMWFVSNDWEQMGNGWACGPFPYYRDDYVTMFEPENLDGFFSIYDLNTTVLDTYGIYHYRENKSVYIEYL